MHLCKYTVGSLNFYVGAVSGEFASALYYRLDRAAGFTNEYNAGAEDRMRAVWTTMFTGLLDGAMPLCRTPEERLFFQQTILDRIVAYPNFRQNNEPDSSGKLIATCVERLKYEGNTHLLREKELPPILKELPRCLAEIELSEQSRIQRGIYKIRQRSRLGRIIYPTSPIRRIIYRFRHLFGMLKRQMSRSFQF